jgi:hypothetical protein
MKQKIGENDKMGKEGIQNGREKKRSKKETKWNWELPQLM